jgi:uncharacterized membrane protein (UPF0136 family)
MIRSILTLASFLSLFLFPYPYTLLLSFVASLFFPWVSLVVGIIADTVYFVPHPPQGGGLSIPYATLFGACASLLALFVRRFMKARIIS